MSSNNKNYETTSGLNTIHAIYYYLVIASCVLTSSISSFILLRRILIDTALPQLRQDTYGYMTTVSRESLRYSYSVCDSQVDNFDEDKCDKEIQRQNDEQSKLDYTLYSQLRAEQYVYSILSILIAAIVATLHVVFFRPKK
jgi:hypothetical protein